MRGQKPLRLGRASSGARTRGGIAGTGLQRLPSRGGGDSVLAVSSPSSSGAEDQRGGATPPLPPSPPQRPADTATASGVSAALPPTPPPRAGQRSCYASPASPRLRRAALPLPPQEGRSLSASPLAPPVARRTSEQFPGRSKGIKLT
ncbi:atherin-like [Cricetulus griseus]|uniref:Atherin-like n=1 Tax=Cricetulus griseus TaxID=10029 RepID=A0A9J7HB93_CRIGR|nr:atherin-like [Cricetulus griseus]